MNSVCFNMSPWLELRILSGPDCGQHPLIWLGMPSLDNSSYVVLKVQGGFSGDLQIGITSKAFDYIGYLQCPGGLGGASRYTLHHDNQGYTNSKTTARFQAWLVERQTEFYYKHAQ